MFVHETIELLAIFLITTIFIYYLYFKYCFLYWKHKGLQTANPSFPAGDILPCVLGQQSIFVRLQQLYTHFKAKNHKNAGIYFFNGPIYFVIDPQSVKRVLVSDFDYFMDRGTYIDEHKYPLSWHMFSMPGQQWKNVRNKFTPMFTAGKMKGMFHILVENARNLVEVLDLARMAQDSMDLKYYLTKYSVDNIGTTVFGIDCNSLKNPNTEFIRMVERIFNPPKWRLFKLFLEEGLQNPGNLMKLTHSDKKVEKFFYDLMETTIKHRNENNVEREDFLNILMKMRESGGISFKEIVAQSFLFFTAGYETSSSTMAFCLHELAHNQGIQRELRAEIHQHLGKDISKYTYDDLMNLPLLDRVFKETLRKYPLVPLFNRICVKTYKIPDTNVVIEKNTPVLISVLGLHRDPDYFPNPLKFDPGRFNKDNHLTPFTYFPFGDGPRNCIGLRFGVMQTKLGLAALLCHYQFLPCHETPRELEFDPTTTTIVLSSKQSICCKILKV